MVLIAGYGKNLDRHMQGAGTQRLLALGSLKAQGSFNLRQETSCALTSVRFVTFTHISRLKIAMESKTNVRDST